MAAQPPVAGRGPSYPFFDLPTAIGKARQMYEYAKRSSVHVSGLVEKWGYTVKSSSGLKTISALKYYGLVDETGAGEAKTVKLTDRALRIIIDAEDSPERKAAVQDAALAPKLYRYCWETWGKDLPADQAIRTALVLNKGFVDSSALPFIKDYKATIEFAGLLSGEEEREGEQDGKPPVKIGDYVQWESGGLLKLEAPKRITRLSDDGEFAFVEGSATGLPIAELTVVEAPVPQGKVNPAINQRQPPKSEAGMRQDVFSIEEGAVTIEWPSILSEASLKDIEDWLAILKRKIARSVQKPSEPENQQKPGE